MQFRNDPYRSKLTGEYGDTGAEMIPNRHLPGGGKFVHGLLDRGPVGIGDLQVRLAGRLVLDVGNLRLIRPPVS